MLCFVILWVWLGGVFWVFDFGLCFVVFDVSSGVDLILVLRVEVAC